MQVVTAAVCRLLLPLRHVDTACTASAQSGSVRDSPQTGRRTARQGAEPVRRGQQLHHIAALQQLLHLHVLQLMALPALLGALYLLRGLVTLKEIGGRGHGRVEEVLEHHQTVQPQLFPHEGVLLLLHGSGPIDVRLSVGVSQ